MRISSASVTLAGVALTGDVGITDLSINGQCVVDVVALSGASGAAAYDRGGATMSVSFTAVREFANDAALEQFAVAHFGTLTKSGALVVTVSGVSKTASAAAVQTMSVGEPIGLLLPVTYSIVCSPLL